MEAILNIPNEFEDYIHPKYLAIISVAFWILFAVWYLRCLFCGIIMITK
jgi:hypothetical protein